MDPDGGSSPPSDGYIEGGGGGRSSIGEGTIAFLPVILQPLLIF